MKKILFTAIAGAALLVGCSADKTDFKKTAEKVLSDEYDKADIKVTVACEEPTATKVGTTFPCTATYTDGSGVDEYTAEITKEDEVTVSPAG